MNIITNQEIEKLRLIREKREQIERLHDNIKTLGISLHPGQIIIAKKVFQEIKKDLMIQCGRNFGKSTCLAYCAVRFALENPNSQVYIIAPERAQAYEIYWAPFMIQNMIPREFLLDGDEAFNKSELRIFFKNGSFIKITGADNHTALRGIKPDWLGCDEFQDWETEAWTAMSPNLLAKNAPVIKIGTPPDRDCFYTKHREYILSELKKGNPRYFYMEGPTAMSPRFSPEMIEEIRQEYVLKGEEAVFRREYLAEYVPGGAKAVFGTLWDRKYYTRRHDELMAVVSRDIQQMKWFTVSDPGTSSCFAVLFGCYNPYTSDIFLLDEIYEKDRNKTSALQIWERIKAKENNLYPNHPQRTFYRIADEAAAWFINEIQYNHGECITPTQKSLATKEQNISTIKDILLYDKLYCSDRLSSFCYEMDNFTTKDNGNFADIDDHLIDCFCYAIAGFHYCFVEGAKSNILLPRNRILDINSFRENNSWTSNIEGLENEPDYFTDIH